MKDKICLQRFLSVTGGENSENCKDTSITSSSELEITINISMGNLYLPNAVMLGKYHVRYLPQHTTQWTFEDY